MLRVDLRLKTGRFHATPWGRHVNEGEAEWPPSPWRFLRALISSWKRTCPEAEVKELLSKLTAPVCFHLPAAESGHTRHYMPQARNRKLLVHDPHMRLVRGCDGKYPPISFVWDEVELTDAERALLERLLLGVSYFGRAESWAEWCLVREPVEANCYPCDSGEVGVLCPEAGASLEELMVETTALREEGWNRPPGSRWVRYVVGGSSRATRESGAKHLALYQIRGEKLPPRQEAIWVAEWVRMAFNGRYGELNDGAASSCFSGKIDGEMRRDQHQHAFFLPYGAGSEIDRVCVYAPGSFDEKELEVVRVIRRFPDCRRQGKLRLVPLELMNLEQIEGEHTCWRSWSPYVCSRHVKKNGRHGPEEQFILECERRGLPEVVSLEPFGEWDDFVWKRWQSWEGLRGPLSGFRVKFKEAVKGPLALGRNCHFGMGVFVP